MGCIKALIEAAASAMECKEEPFRRYVDEYTKVCAGMVWAYRLPETTEAMRVLWTEKECSYKGDLVRFPPVRCDPKPVQKPYPPILLGALGPQALERVARTYHGWCPAAGKPETLKRDADTIRKLAKENGRDPESIRIEPFIGPGEDGISLDDLKRYKEAGVDRLILFSQKDAMRMAHGRALEVIRRLAPTVERGQHV